MPPQNTYPPAPPPPPVNPTQYEFIMTPGSQPRSKMPGGPTKLLVIVGGLAAIVIVAVILLSAFSGNKVDDKPFIAVARQQQEIIRVSDLQYSSLSRQNVKNFAINSQLSLSTDKSKFLLELKKHGIKISDKQILAGANTATDTTLTNAQASSTLDTTLQSTLQEELKTYQTALKQTYAVTKSVKVREMLKSLNDNAELLLKQSQQ